MNKDTYLLVCLLEELGEACTELCEVDITKIDNCDLSAYVGESNDVVGCVELLIDNGTLPNSIIDQNLVNQKFHLLLENNCNTLDLISVHLKAHKAVSKMIRFGVNHIHPFYNREGKAVLGLALIDLFAWNQYLDYKYSLPKLYDRKAIDAKKVKVYKYLAEAINDGRVINTVE
jgi:hypothetical protein